MRLDAAPIGSLLGKNVFHQVRQDRVAMAVIRR